MKKAASIFLGCMAIAGAFVAGYILLRPGSASPPPVTSVPGPQTPIAATTQAEPPFVIRKALYGDLPDGPSKDVTEQVAAAFDGTRLSLPVSNDTFGGDPAFGAVKKLRVEYAVNGKTLFRTAREGDTLTIALHQKPVPLVILKAVYGDFPLGSSSDVTPKVQEAFDGHELSIAASNDNFGDPAPNIPKRLRVLYTLDGTEKYQIVEEGQTLTIAAETTQK